MNFDLSRVERALDAVRWMDGHARRYVSAYSDINRHGYRFRPETIARARRTALAFRTVALIEHDRILRGAA